MIATINLIRSSSAVASDNQAYRLNQPTPPLERHRKMKHLLLTTIAAVVLVGCGNPDGALAKAARRGNIEVAKQAIADGADVNAKDDNGETPLNWAIFNDETETADLLRKHGGKTGAELKAEGK